MRYQETTSALMNTMPNTPPPPPTDLYHIALNGNQEGPYTFEQLKEMTNGGGFTKQHYVWKQGMKSWELAEKVTALITVFDIMPPKLPDNI